MKRLVVASTMILFAALLVPACGRLHPGAATGRPAATTSDDSDDRLQLALQSTLRAVRPPQFVTRDAEGARLWKETRAFYQAREFTPAWIAKGTPGRHMDTLISALRAAEADGIDPELYGLSLLEQRRREAGAGFLSRRSFDPGQAAAMDTWLTYLYMQYASDLAVGMSDLAHADPEWQIETAAFDARAHLEQALRDDRVAESLAGLLPADADYRALRKALGDYRQLAAKGDWPTLPATLKLKPGQSSEAVPVLVRRLAASGEFNADDQPGDKPGRTERRSRTPSSASSARTDWRRTAWSARR